MKTKISFNLTDDQWRKLSEVLVVASSKIEGHTDDAENEYSLFLDQMIYKIDCTLKGDAEELKDWESDI